MSWFGGGLSSITSQISTFTKEVLTETTEEIQDPTAELHVARRRVAELDELNKKLHSERERLNRLNEEVVERADTAELQIATISQEYRKIIQEKENDLRRLKNENETLREEQRRLLSRDVYPGVSSGEFQFASQDDLNNRDIQDVSDMITSQSEINRLQTELATVRMECAHWKAVAQESPDNNENSVPQLQRKIEELQSSLLQETARSQQELSALQSLHTSRLQSLVQKHREEMAELQGKLNAAELKQKQGEEDASELKGGLESLRVEGLPHGTSVPELTLREEAVQDHEIHSGELCRHCGSTRVALESQLAKEKETNLQLEIEVAALKDQLMQERSALIGMLDHEKQLLTEQLVALQTSISDQQASSARLLHDHNRLQQEAEDLQQTTKRLMQELREKEEEVATLKRCGSVVAAGVQDQDSGEDPLLDSTLSTAVIPSNNGTVSPNGKTVVTNEEIVTPGKDPNNEQLQHCGSDALVPASLYEELEGTIKSLKEAIQVERAQRERLTAHMAQLTADHDRELSLLLEEKESLMGEMSSLKDDLERTDTWREQTLTESMALKVENVGLREEVAKLEREVALHKEAALEMEERLKVYSDHVSALVHTEHSTVLLPAQDKLDLAVSAVVAQGEQQEHGDLKAMEELVRDRDREIADLRRYIQECEEQVGQHLTEEEVPAPEAPSPSNHTDSGLGHRCVPLESTEEEEGQERYIQRKAVSGERDMDHLVAFQQSQRVSDEAAREVEQLKLKMELLQSERIQLESDLKVQKGLLRACECKLESREQECAKYVRELERLKPHLIELQDQFAQEALRYQQEEAEMKRYMKGLEDRLKSSSTADLISSQQLQTQLKSLEQQVRVLTGQRDDALSRLTRVGEEAKENAIAVSNLQAALELLQREQASELNASTKYLQRKLTEVQEECNARNVELQSTKLELQKLALTASSSLELKEEMARKESSIVQLQARVNTLQASLDKAQEQVTKLSGDSSTKLDRSLVKNMVVQYTQAGNQRKRQEVLQLIARILDVAPEELDPNLGKSSGWLTGLWSKPVQPLSSSSSSSLAVEDRGSLSQPSLSQLFVSFLETESSRQKSSAHSVPSPGYIDLKSDPDRPSRATAAILTGLPPPPSHFSFSPPTASSARLLNQTVPSLVSNALRPPGSESPIQSTRQSLTGQSIVSASPSQSAALKSILSTTLP